MAAPQAGEVQQQRFLGRAVDAGLTTLLPFEAPEHELDLRSEHTERSLARDPSPRHVENAPRIGNALLPGRKVHRFSPVQSWTSADTYCRRANESPLRRVT
ncbi:hypothetical protein R6L23_34285 [Streptomyces sp. SR27]|uniref:hypothetical protein n=1 Tax=Streptomyces sp. SR27 TaxID=3076630 RepID=UPI00295B65AC|nr:hypothetical protein [Streptomyces sp. SR27]MDV9193224.1 hypothetical protein [Streptomyces sp. SR27]